MTTHIANPNRRMNKSVHNLSRYLTRHGLPNADIIAKLLLTEGTNVYYPGATDDSQFRINIAGTGPFSAVIGPKITATDLRLKLIKAGLLTSGFETDGPGRWKLGLTPKLEKYRADYSYEVQGIANPAVALKKEVERLEKKAAKENAKLRDEIELLKKGQEASQEQFKAIWAAIQHIERNDAPVTEEKIARHLRVV